MLIFYEILVYLQLINFTECYFHIQGKRLTRWRN